MEAAESRFAQLLKPIRELTQNWEVDLASQLGDYLHEVSSPGMLSQPVSTFPAKAG